MRLSQQHCRHRGPFYRTVPKGVRCDKWRCGECGLHLKTDTMREYMRLNESKGL